MRHRSTAILGATLAIALAGTLGGCTTRVVTTDNATPLYTVTASGTGTTAAVPDVAEMYFGATVLDANAKTALTEASTTADAITKAVKALGVAQEDIQTANVSVYPQYSSQEGKTTKITGYAASIQVRVKLRDFAAIGDVITAASTAGANEISGPSFTLSDDASARSECLQDAVADARSQAEVMAGAADKHLGDIISISQSSVSVPVIYREQAAAAAADAGVPIEPGQIDVTANVTIVFELR